MTAKKPQALPLGSREAILAVDDIVTERVDVPEWGCSVLVATMSGEQRDAFEGGINRERRAAAKKGIDLVPRDVRAKFVSRVCVDEQGARLFTNDDVPALTRKSAAGLERIAVVGQRLAGMRDEDVKRIEGNSGAQSGGSTTG